MKIAIYDTKNQKTGEVELPRVFSEPINNDLIKTAVEAASSRARQPYGADPQAGKKYVAKLSRRRRKYKTSYGIGISRVPRKIMSHAGTRFNWVGALAPGTVGGRRAHPPKAEKIFEKKLNKKERKKALRSAIAATIDRDLVSKSSIVPANYPFAIDSSFEQLKKTKDVYTALKAIGFEKELERSSIKKIRPGKGKARSRKYRRKKGVLLVTSSQMPLGSAARNIPGIEIVEVGKLNIMLLAPGFSAGRATIFTSGAIEKISKDKMFEVTK